MTRNVAADVTVTVTVTVTARRVPGRRRGGPAAVTGPRRRPARIAASHGASPSQSLSFNRVTVRVTLRVSHSAAKLSLGKCSSLSDWFKFRNMGIVISTPPSSVRLVGSESASFRLLGPESMPPSAGRPGRWQPGPPGPATRRRARNLKLATHQ